MEEKYDKYGFNEKGLHKNGTYYDEYGFDAFRRNEEGVSFDQIYTKGGYTKEGFDKEGFDRDGFDKEGFNKEGVHKDAFKKRERDFNIEEELDKIIGLQNVKDIIREQYIRLLAREKRRKNNIIVNDSQALNMIFTGNPGTGKTMAARLLSKMFLEFGILKSDKIVEVDRSMLASQYQGATAKKTRDVFKSALGGVLIVDEAYSLYNGDLDESGKEAINTIVKLIEDYRDDIVVILTGYKKEMNEFLDTNSGLKSRFPFNIEFNDYSIDEVYSIGLNMFRDRGFTLDNRAKVVFKREIENLNKTVSRDNGNGRMVRNLVEDAIRKQSVRIVYEDAILNEVKAIDLENNKGIDKTFNLENSIVNIKGLDNIKTFLRGINAKLKIDLKRREFGLDIVSGLNNMIFLGNIGMGKKSIGKIVSEMMYSYGILETRNISYVGRADLVAGHVGQTAIKTRAKVKEAVGGVLYVNEAHTLLDGDYGFEALDEILKGIDTFREKIVVILGGDTEKMNMLLSLKGNMKERFRHIIQFKDYKEEELLYILMGLFTEENYIVDFMVMEKLIEKIKKSEIKNLRHINRLFEEILVNQAIRLERKVDITIDELMEIKEEDIK